MQNEIKPDPKVTPMFADLIMDVLFDADPECEHELIHTQSGGIACSHCGGWFMT